ncbi:Gfo/Idh/MocA family oxidoreductase [Tissierella praeacuta]|uniref:Gfo/Idh/MocA family protein n=1 Tax=Tissierella praeacuta TaxID=43131 RepID=UPI0033418B9E
MGQVKPVNVAIIGCGTISEIYMKNLREMFHITNLVACADLIDERAQKRADQFGIKNMKSEEIYNSPDIDLVVNLTKPESHYEVSKKALLSGKHCVVEKMMCTTFEEALELCDIARKENLMFGSVPDTFLGGGWQTVRHYIDSGIIGKPITMNAVITCSYQPNTARIDCDSDNFFFPLHTGGGLPYDLGGYYLHNMINMFGTVKKVSAFGGNLYPNREYINPRHPKYKEPYRVNTPTTMSVILEFEIGVLCTFLISSDASVFDSFTVQGSKAMLELFNPNFFSGKILLHRQNAIKSEEDGIGFTVDNKYRPDPDIVELPILHGYCGNSRGIGVADMAYAIRNKRRPRMHFDLGLHALEIIHGMLKSAEMGIAYNMTTSCDRPNMRQQMIEADDVQERTIDD